MAHNNLGNWANDDLASTVRSNVGSSYYQGRPISIRFAHSVAKILQKRLAVSEATLHGAPSVYILGTCPKIEGASVTRQRMFDAGNVEVAGYIWFGPESMASSGSFPLPSTEANDVFDYVDKILGAGDLPAIYFDATADKSVMRFYPKGLNADTEREFISFVGANLTAQMLKEMLDRVHVNLLITPTASGAAAGLWQDQGQAYPVKESERAIQNIVESSLSLTLALGSLFIRRENTGTSGRYDLAVIGQDPFNASIKVDHAMLELKVVKSHTNTGSDVPKISNAAAISKGLRQANSYRKEHSSRIAAVCCYDMQKNHTASSTQSCLDHVRKRANILKVELWAWPLFSTTEKHRVFEDANQQP